jgi:uncharacterized membrane protein
LHLHLHLQKLAAVVKKIYNICIMSNYWFGSHRRMQAVHVEVHDLSQEKQKQQLFVQARVQVLPGM